MRCAGSVVGPDTADVDFFSYNHPDGGIDHGRRQAVREHDARQVTRSHTRLRLPGGGRRRVFEVRTGESGKSRENGKVRQRRRSIPAACRGSRAPSKFSPARRRQSSRLPTRSRRPPTLSTRRSPPAAGRNTSRRITARASDPKMRIMTLKRGAHALNVFITVAPAQNNATSVQYSEVPLKTDLPFTKDASAIEYSPDRPLLTLITARAGRQDAGFLPQGAWRARLVAMVGETERQATGRRALRRGARARRLCPLRQRQRAEGGARRDAAKGRGRQVQSRAQGMAGRHSCESAQGLSQRRSEFRRARWSTSANCRASKAPPNKPTAPQRTAWSIRFPARSPIRSPRSRNCWAPTAGSHTWRRWRNRTRL